MFIEINRGRSFRGLAQYCLHDVGHETSYRVDFVETRNVASDNPQVAWRIMASRAYVQDELKEKAGVSAAGRKNGKPVGHMLISWGREEADAQKLDRENMLKAAEGALASIGADKHQAMIVAHNDTADKSPHCHVIINLIGEDGRLKKNWKEREKLSRFALDEEIRVHGKPIVKERNKRWHDRDAGETPAPMKKKSRHLYELEKAAEQDNKKAVIAKELLAKQKELELAKQSQNERQGRNRERLHQINQERERRVKAQTEGLIRRAKTNARHLYNDTWHVVHERHQFEQDQFDQKEQSVRGSIENGFRLVDWFKLFQRPKDTGKESLRDLFQVLTSEGRRREILNERQEAERAKMREAQNKAEREAAAIAKQMQQQKLNEIQSKYVRKAEHMKLRQQRNSSLLIETQRKITADRNAALKEYRQQEQVRKRKQSLNQKIRRDFDEAAEQDDAERILGDSDTEKTEEGGGSTLQSIRQQNRKRNPRDPERSRRKRDIDTLQKADSVTPTEPDIPAQESDAEFDARMKKEMDSRSEIEKYKSKDFDFDR